MLSNVKSILENLYYKSMGIVLLINADGTKTTFKRQEIKGQIWFNTADLSYYIWDGNKWIKM